MQITRLRKVLHGDGEQILATCPRGYTLHVDEGAVDADRFECLLASGAHALGAGRAREASETLRSGLGLWRGRPFGDVADEPFAEVESARLEEQRLSALETRLEADLALGRHAAIVAELEALVREHPLREGFRAQLMLTLYRCGRQAHALDAYREGRRMLVEELGIEPGPSLRRLEQAILAQDPALHPASMQNAFKVVVGPARRCSWRRIQGLRPSGRSAVLAAR